MTVAIPLVQCLLVKVTNVCLAGSGSVNRAPTWPQPGELIHLWMASLLVAYFMIHAHINSVSASV